MKGETDEKRGQRAFYWFLGYVQEWPILALSLASCSVSAFLTLDYLGSLHNYSD